MLLSDVLSGRKALIGPANPTTRFGTLPQREFAFGLPRELLHKLNVLPMDSQRACDTPAEITNAARIVKTKLSERLYGVYAT